MERKFKIVIPDPLGGPEIIYEGLVSPRIRHDGDFDGYDFIELRRDGCDILHETKLLTAYDRQTFFWQLTQKIGY